MGDNVPLNAVKMVTDKSGKVLGVEDLERGQSIPIEQVSDGSKFVCEEGQFAPYSASVGGSRWGSIGDAIGRLADGIKEAVEPAIEGAIGIFEGAKEFCATIIQKVKEEAVAQNMKKGAEDCAIKKEQPANKETSKKSDTITNEGSACLTPSDSSGPQQAMIKNDRAELSRNEVDENGRAGREAIRAEVLSDLSGEAATGEVEVSTLKKEDAPTKTAAALPNSAVADDGSVDDVGDKKMEQAIRDKAEQAEKIEAEKVEGKIARDVTNANALQDDADPDKTSAKETRDGGVSRPLNVDGVPAQNGGESRVAPGSSGDGLVTRSYSPFVPNDMSPLAYNFDPLASVGQRVEELFPAVIQNFVGCFTYLQFQKNAHEDGSNSFSHTQAMTGERGEKVWPAGKKEGGDNRFDQGNSKGRDKRDEDPENNFPEFS